ncbi:hypothetical protein D3C75_1237700 [compost metagenome]
MLAVSFVDCFKSIPPNFAVRALQELDIAAVCQLYFLAFFILDLGELQVRIVQHAEDRLRCLGDITDLGEQGFFRFGQDMRLFTLHFRQSERVSR